MAIMLTGGTGYIGSHTAVRLLETGRDVVILDNFSNSGRDVPARIEQITGIRPTVYEGDVTDREDLVRVFAENAITAVMHFAGYKSVGESVREPVCYYRNNLDGVLTLLEVMAEHSCHQFVFSSSATVYGQDHPSPLTEEMPAGGCVNPYGWTKYMAERILEDAARADEKLSVIILRYFNPIGAHPSGLIGERPSGIPNNLMPYLTQTAFGLRERLNVFGDDYPTPDGTGVRDYIHVMDLAQGHLAALTYGEHHTGSEIFNLGTGRGTSVLELITAFREATGVEVPYVITDRRAGDVAVSYADAGKAERVLGWRAERTIQEMCRDAWNWERRMREETPEA